MSREVESAGDGETGSGGGLGLLRALRIDEGRWSSPDMPAEQRRRRTHVALGLLFILPAVSVFVIADLRHGRLPEAAATGALMALLTAMLVQLLRRRPILDMVRLAVASSFAVIVYDTLGEGGDGLAFLWLYVQPLIVFFLFGKKEGAAWAAAGFAVAFTLFAASDLPHAPGMAVRFLTSFAIISVFAFGLEASRRRYWEELLAETTALEVALAQVKILRGLLPICVRCKSIRDDQGYWNQIESYIGRHSEAELSRSLCPQCRAADSGSGSHASVDS